MNTYIASTSEVTLRYEGTALAGNTMDARELVLALAAMCGMFERANVLANGNQASINLRIRTTSPGSVEILLALGMQAAATIFGEESGMSAATLRRLIIEFITSVKKLKGSRPVATVTPRDEVFLEIGSLRKGELEIENMKIYESSLGSPISNQLLHLLEDSLMCRSASEFVEPLRHEGIDTLTISDGQTQLESITKEDTASFALMQTERTRSHPVARKELVVVYPYLGIQSGRWRLNDGNNSQNYTMKDSVFEEEVRNRTRSFTTGDVLICDVLTIDVTSKNGVSRTDFEILKVHSQRSADAQDVQLSYDLDL